MSSTKPPHEENSMPEWAKKLVSELTAKLDDLTSENDNLKELVTELQDNYDEMADAIYELESDLGKLAQYGRKQNLQIRGISKNVSQKDLENYVINLFEKMGIKLDSYDIAIVYTNQKDKSRPSILN